MFKKFAERRRTARRYRIAMAAAHEAVLYMSGTIHRIDVVDLAYANSGIRLTPDEAEDALRAAFAKAGRRPTDMATAATSD
jgi:hypothetical protein